MNVESLKIFNEIKKVGRKLESQGVNTNNIKFTCVDGRGYNDYIPSDDEEEYDD